jgi:hypothetical protein
VIWLWLSNVQHTASQSIIKFINYKIIIINVFKISDINLLKKNIYKRVTNVGGGDRINQRVHFACYRIWWWSSLSNVIGKRDRQQSSRDIITADLYRFFFYEVHHRHKRDLFLFYILETEMNLYSTGIASSPVLVATSTLTWL